MKKLLLIFTVFLCSNFSIAQCLIRGVTSPQVGSTSNYSVPSGTAQCTSCYYWTISGSASISGSNTSNSVSIVPNSVGSFTLNLTYFSNGNCYTCTKTGTIVQNNSCDFQVGVSSLYISSANSNPPTVTLQAGTTPGSLIGVTYNWMVTYQNGSTAGASTTAQLATFTAYQSNPIVSANVIAYYQNCSSTFLRNFPIPIYGGLSEGMGLKNANNRFEVSPNPTKSIVTFNGENKKDYTISIFDMFGREIFINNTLDKDISLDNYSSGIYQYIIIGKDYRQEGKIIKD